MAKFNEYPAKTIPKDADKFMLYSAEDSANKLIDYDKLADAVLDKLTSKQFTLDQGTKTLLSALNELNSNRFPTLYTLGGKYRITISNTLYNSLLIWGLYGTTPILTIVALNAEQKPGVCDLAGKDYITATLISGITFELSLDSDAAVRIVSINECTFEKIAT